MSTSLKEQLQRLAVPQTTFLTDSLQKASILFDPKEAATKDRRTIYELGLSGLQDLIAINSNFEQFKATLFDETTINLERAVEQSSVNRLLDLNIRKFLWHLSPYFLLRPSHMCLEWLLRRFQVHEYNRSELLAVALPYHETNVFVRILQTMRLKESDVDWGWLRPLQKPGVPLPKSAIINRAASDAGFLRFVCSSTMTAVKELKLNARLLQSQLNFYTTVAIGALENATRIQEWHVSTLLPPLLKGFDSEWIDYVSSSYMVAAQLLRRTQLTQKACNALIKRAANVTFERLRRVSVLLLIHIFDSQAASNPQLSDEILGTLVQQQWLTEILASLVEENVSIQALCAPLIRGAIVVVQKSNSDSQYYRRFLEQLLNEVKFPNATAQQIINTVLDSFVTEPINSPSVADANGVIALDSDSELADGEHDFQKWYADYLQKLERQYPDAFDVVTKEAIENSGSQNINRSNAIRLALGFRLKTANPEAMDIFQNLYHHTSQIRLIAVQKLYANFSNYRERHQNYQLLKEVLADRICDDSELVVAEVLKLSTKDFLAILGQENFVNALLSIINRTQTDPEHWLPLTVRVVNHLTSDLIVEQYDANIILLALMPVLFPNDSSPIIHNAIVEILQSKLLEKFEFLKKLKVGATFNAAEIRRQFLNVLASGKHEFELLDLLRCIESHSDYFFKSCKYFAHILILATACLNQKNTDLESLEVLDRIFHYSRRFKVKCLSQDWEKQSLSDRQFIPLQLYSDFLIALVRVLPFTSAPVWEPRNPGFKCYLKILDLVSEGVFTATLAPDREVWTKTLKELFQVSFKTSVANVAFLANFYITTELSFIPNYALLRVKTLRLVNCMLKTNPESCALSTVDVLKVTMGFNSESGTIRTLTVETLELASASDQLESSLKIFVDSLLKHKHKMAMDHEQYALVLCNVLAESRRKRHAAAFPNILEELIKLLKADNATESNSFTPEILKAIKYINDKHTLGELIPLASQALDRTINDGASAMKMLKEPCYLVYQLVSKLFDWQNIGNVLQENPEAWELIEKLFTNHDVFLTVEGKLMAVPCVVLEAIDEHIFRKMSAKHRLRLLQLIVSTVVKADNDTLFLAANNLLKNCSVDCPPLVTTIQQMYAETHAETLPRSPKGKQLPKHKAKPVCNSQGWREGVVLLELLETNKNLHKAEKLIPVLFELLTVCLEAEDQPAAEYTKQLTLSILLHCCQLARAKGIDLPALYPKATFRIDQVVQCVRGTQNPQTQHNALLLLSHCASLFPQLVLHNIVNIFTFMGSSVVRKDDTYSFHIINTIIESIVPILTRDRAQGPSNQDTLAQVAPVLKVFSDIMLDVPEHRRLPLYTKLLTILDAEEYLWVYTGIVLEAHVVSNEKSQASKQLTGTQHPRLAMALELINTFPVEIILETCIQLAAFLKKLPAIKSNLIPERATHPSVESYIFDVKARTEQQLRHFKYAVMQFISSVCTSSEFLRKMALLTADELAELKPYYQNFIIEILSYVSIVNRAIEESTDQLQTRFWKIVLHHCHDVLTNTIALLSADMFLMVVNRLCEHELLSVRVKVLELLNKKLQQRDSDYFVGCDEQNFFKLITTLIAVVDKLLEEPPSSEMALIQQNSLIALKLLSQMFALKQIAEFKTLLTKLTEIIERREKVSKVSLATVVLTATEVSCNLRVHSLGQMPKFMPLLIEVLRDQAEFVLQQTPNSVTVGIITGLQKLFEALPLFLGPYVVNVITSLSTMYTRIAAQQDKDQKSQIALQKISTVITKIAVAVPLRTVVPSCEKAYTQIMTRKSYEEIKVLMQLLQDAIKNSASADIAIVQTDLSKFFMTALGFRLNLKDSGSSFDTANTASTEGTIIDAFVALVMKLSESSLRPLYQRVYEWALKDSPNNEKILTYFLLTQKIAETLKSLFVNFSGEFIEDVGGLLNASNTLKENIDVSSEDIHIQLLRAVLNTLHNVFLHDSVGFMSGRRFELLLQPIVDQFENRLVLENEELQQILVNCVSQLAVAVSSDVYWKQLNYQVLLKTRTNVPEVRILSFNACVEIARKLTDDFTALLRETVPFIAELFEDENPRVEKNTRKAVQELESILGESLQQYL